MAGTTVLNKATGQPPLTLDPSDHVTLSRTIGDGTEVNEVSAFHSTGTVRVGIAEGYLILRNTLPDRRVVYKIKTTAPKDYLVKPSTGFVAANGEVKVHLSSTRSASEDNEKQRYDKFLIQSFVEETEITAITRDTWGADRECYFDQRISVEVEHTTRFTAACCTSPFEQEPPISVDVNQTQQEDNPQSRVSDRSAPNTTSTAPVAGGVDNRVDVDATAAPHPEVAADVAAVKGGKISLATSAASENTTMRQQQAISRTNAAKTVVGAVNSKFSSSAAAGTTASAARGEIVFTIPQVLLLFTGTIMLLKILHLL